MVTAAMTHKLRKDIFLPARQHCFIYLTPEGMRSIFGFERIFLTFRPTNTVYLSCLLRQSLNRGNTAIQTALFMRMQFFKVYRPFDPPHKSEHIYDDSRITELGTFYYDYSTRAVAAREAKMWIMDMPDYNPPSDLTERQGKQWIYPKSM